MSGAPDMKSSQLHADTETSRLWDRIRKVEYDNNDAAARISKLEAGLRECRAHVIQLMTMIDETLANSRNVPGNEGQNLPEKGKDFPPAPDMTSLSANPNQESTP